MTRVDLDTYEANLRAMTRNTTTLEGAAAIERGFALAAELRAAREVVEEADSLRAFLSQSIIDKLDDYFEAVGS